MKLHTLGTSYTSNFDNEHTSFTFNSRQKYFALLSTIRPLILWCTTTSIFSLFGILFLHFNLKNGIIATIPLSIFSNIACQLAFLLLLFSRVMSTTFEHYLTASLTLFNDLVLTIPRYVLWELIFTSRWIWLSLHFFSAIYSIFIFWNICTLFLLELPVFLSTLFFVTGGLSFVRFFGKNQNIFLLSSQISSNPMIIKLNIKERNNLLFQFLEITDYFIFNGCSGDIKNSFVFTILTLLITIPIYYFGINTPGISNFFNLINKFCPFRTGFKSMNELNSFISILYIYFSSFITVSFYWYCIELQSTNFRNLSLVDINSIFIKDSSINDDNKYESNIPSDNFIRFITNLQKRFIFFGNKKKMAKKLCLKIVYSFYSIFALFTILPVLFLFNLRKIKALVNILTKRIPINSNIVFDEWLLYEYRLFFAFDKLQRQLDNIFSTVILLDSSIHTKVATIDSNDFRLVVQSTIGLDRRVSFSQINTDDWLLHAKPLINHSERINHIPRSINTWWYNNILFSDSLNNPKVKNRRKKTLEWDIKDSIVQFRSEIFCILLEKFKKCCKKTEGSLTGLTENESHYSKESEMLPQIVFLMQEMALYTIDLCYLYVYCYHRFVSKNLIINGLRGEWNAQTLNQYINLSVEFKNRIYFAREVGLLDSPYVHPVFEQEIIRLYREIEDSLELLLSLL